jgi:ribonuclease BN (tRNA processing enzyme)
MGRIRYLCVGSGTCVPRIERGPACHLIQVGDLRIVLDLGSGSLRTLARLDEPIGNLAAVGISHRHMDHVADLLPLLFALRYAPGERRTAPLELFGYPGLRGDLERSAQTFGNWVLDPGFELRIHELPPGRRLRLGASADSVEVESHRVSHTPEAVAFRIDASSGEGGVSRAVIAYSGDSGPDESLVGLARGADLFVCECAFPDGEGVPIHLTPSGLLAVCAAARPRRVVATHFYPVWDQRGVGRLWAEALAKAGVDVDVVPGHDGLAVEIAS